MQYMTVSLQTCERQREPLISQILNHTIGKQGIEETIKICLMNYLFNILSNNENNQNTEPTNMCEWGCLESGLIKRLSPSCRAVENTRKFHNLSKDEQTVLKSEVKKLAKKIFNPIDSSVHIDVKNGTVKSDNIDPCLKKIKIIRDRSHAYLFPKLYEYTKQSLSPTYTEHFKQLSSLELGQLLKLLNTKKTASCYSVRPVEDLFFEETESKPVNYNSYDIDKSDYIGHKTMRHLKDAGKNIDMKIIGAHIDQKAFSLIETQEFSDAINLEQIYNMNVQDNSHVDKLVCNIKKSINIIIKIKNSKRHLVYLKNKINHVANGSRGRTKKNSLSIQLEAHTERLGKLKSDLKLFK